MSSIAKKPAVSAKLTAMLSGRPSDPASIEPYHAAMPAMANEMMAAQGANVTEVYLRKMLALHKGALSMSEIVLACCSEPKVKKAAAAVKADQTKEVRETEAMLATI